VAFYYGENVPPELPELFDYLVLQPDQLPGGKPLADTAARQCAYISMGETHPSEVRSAALPLKIFISSNSAWGTLVPDQGNPVWRAYVSSRAASLWDAGWRCLFLDTLDSYELAGETRKRAQAAALAENIAALHRGRGFELMFNRGFDLLPSIGYLGSFIVAESLYRSFTPGAINSFFEVQPQDSQWLMEQLLKARDVYGLKPVVIDYVRAGERQLARRTARRIAAQGFIPWVADPDLTWPGTGLAEAQPRKLLVLYDGNEYPDGPWYSDFHNNIEAVFEYLGLVTEFHDVTKKLPKTQLNGRYAGVVSWFADDTVVNPADLRAFYLKCLGEKVPLLMLGFMGFPADAEFLEKLGMIEHNQGLAAQPFELVEPSPLVGFEAKPPLLTRDLQPWRAETALRRHVRIKDGKGKLYDAVFTSSWGGAAFAPFLTARGFEDTPRYIINPFAFFAEALQLEPFPVPDPTTENGRAILTVHIDGDGSPSRAEYPPNRLSLQELYERVLSKYPLPTTMGP
ncbi:MAG TPA: endo alpha-1,4 polygalactosaminidase, partial [Elusimicrobiales bacterium]|nr:endo alpha-1,4 polygalactosaminidase [Elusimicrobiales bacterium]